MVLRLGLLPTNSSESLLSAMTAKGLDANTKTFNGEDEAVIGHFHRELTFSSVRDSMMFLDAVQQQLKESSGRTVFQHGVLKANT